MATALYNRDDDGGSCLSDDGAYIYRQAIWRIESFLAQAEEDGPVDLRDLQSVLYSAVDDVLLKAIITRRLSTKENRGDKSSHAEIVEGHLKWKCDSERAASDDAVCLYNTFEDPMHDNCIICGLPEERK
jgi:hypothetical protein